MQWLSPTLRVKTALFARRIAARETPPVRGAGELISEGEGVKDATQLRAHLRAKPNFLAITSSISLAAGTFNQADAPQ